MKILFIPFLIILMPSLVLLLSLRYFGKTRRISVLMRIAFGIVFMSIGIVTTYFAILTSMSGMSEKGITCMTGVAAFIPLSFLANVIGIPLILVLNKSGTKENLHKVV